MEQVSRRELLLAASAVLAGTSSAAATGVPTRVLGRTGQRVSVIGIGGFHVATPKDERESIRIMHAAVDEGVNFFDNCWDYHEGRAEEVMGKALAMDGYRKKVFLMTKVCGRDYETAKKHLDDSLRRLKTDYLDLWQFHELVFDNDPDYIFDQGAIRAAEEARKAGKVRYIGFTGHKDPRIHLKMLAKPFPWDSAQMPINVCDATYRSFQNDVVPVCLKNNVGVIGMKGLGGGFPDGRLVANAGLSVEECYSWCLNLPVSTQVMGITSMEQLKQDLKLAREFKPLSSQAKQALLARVKGIAGDGRYELFKSSMVHDSPIHRRQHGFSEKMAD
jgi:uncharacterized protein